MVVVSVACDTLMLFVVVRETAVDIAKAVYVVNLERSSPST
jgi:hypothetical protein